MTLPKVKNKKPIPKDFIANAKKVKKILEEESRYLLEKKLKDEYSLSHNTSSRP